MTPLYELPLHRSLTEPMLLGGVPRSFAILNGTLLAALVLALHAWFAIPLGLVTHAVAVAATKRDPDWIGVLRRHLRLASYCREG